jgi:hypothetical protein
LARFSGIVAAMSSDAHVLPPVSPDEYSEARARWLVERYASCEPGTSLYALRRADPGYCPSPLAVRRWRRDYPAFNAAMEEAESVRADALMEQTLDVADRQDVNAAVSKNGMAARWRMAEALAPDRYKGRETGSGGTVVFLSDSVLAMIAAGADPGALLRTPTAPPLPARAGFTGGSEVVSASNTSDPENAQVVEVVSEKKFLRAREVPGVE